MRFRLAAALVTAALVASSATAQASTPRTEVSAPASAPASASVSRSARVTMRSKAWERRVVKLTNARRAAHGARPLKAATCPHRFAAPWARHLARTHQLVHHLPLKPLFKCLKNATSAGENIAEGFPTARSVVRAWMSDKGHRDNLLNPSFTRIGIAGARIHGVTYAVQDFVGRAVTHPGRR
jgi:uncharacterized protein YkwD